MVLNQYGRQIKTGLLLLSIALIAFLTYRNILDYFFTGMDAIPLIDSSRILSVGDLVKVFTEPGLREFPEAFGLHKWYRPVSVLSYSLDYYIWKLNPFGYHLTDIVLHVMVAVSVFFLARLLMDGRQITAWLSALIFSVHPLIVEVVPAVVRRMDVIATLFVLISLIFFLKYYSSGFLKTRYLLISLFAFILAIGAKEVAVVVPMLVFIYIFLFFIDQSFSPKGRVMQAFKISFFYLVVMVFYLFIRIIVLHGIGGYADSSYEMQSFLTFLLMASTDYVIALLYPVDFLYSGKLAADFPPLFSPVLRGVFIGMVFLTVVFKWKKITGYFSDSGSGRIKAFLLAWILLPLTVYLVTMVSGRYYLYITVVPFSILLSMTLVESFEAMLQKRGRPCSSTIIFSLTALLSASLLLFSPLIRTYGEWGASGEIFNSLLSGVSEALPLLPDNAVINIYDLPVGIASYKHVTPHAEEVEYPDGYSIRSWLELNFSHRRIKNVFVKSRMMIPDYPAEQSLKVTHVNDKTLVMTVGFEYGQ